MKIALYTLFEETNLEIGATMIYSFLENNGWFDGDIYVLCDEGTYCKFSEEKREVLKKISDKIKFYEVNSADYKDVIDNFPNTTGIWKACFYKLELLKKDDYDAKLYVDGDTCFNGNVKYLFNMTNTFNVKYFMCRDRCSHGFTRIDNCVKTPNDYANAGVMLVNSQLIDENEYQRVYDFCKSVKKEDFKNNITFKGVYPEQDCFNECLDKMMLVPSALFNCNIELYGLAKDMAAIIHYYGSGVKPWDCKKHFPAFDIWYRNHYFAKRIIDEI